MKAILRKIRISPKKANLVAGMVRGKSVTQALQILEVMPKKGAKILWKVVKSAASNAQENFKQSVDELYITKILVTKGPTYKRSLPISRGRVHPIAKRTSHITVEVGIQVKDTPKTPQAKQAESHSAKTKHDEASNQSEAGQKKSAAQAPTAKKSTTAKKEATQNAPKKANVKKSPPSTAADSADKS